MTIKEIAFAAINRLIERISENHIDTTYPVEGNYLYESTLKRGHEKVKLQVYFGKKGVKTVVQGDKKLLLYNDVMDIVSGSEELNLTGEDFIEPDSYIGSDESGKGDFFGPLVVAAAAVDKDSKQQLRKLYIKDSKEYSDTEISSTAPTIKEILKNRFIVRVVKPQEYNTLYERYLNLNRMLAFLHSDTIKELLQKTECNDIIVDKFGNEKLLIAGFSGMKKKIKLHQFTKGERYIGVAAASILAREAFISWFDEIKEKTGISLPKGASDKVIEALRIMVNKYGNESKVRLVKMHFKNSLKF